MRSVIVQKGGCASSERDVAVHQDVGGAFCGEFGCGDSEHVRAAAEAIREKVDVRVSSGRGWQGPKVVDTDRDARAVGQGYREDWPVNSLVGVFACLTL